VYSGHIAPEINKAPAFNPNDILKTTIKQTTLIPVQNGNVSGISNSHNIGYTSNNYEAKTTLKQLIEDSIQAGNLSGATNAYNGGYMTNPQQAKTTIRQVTGNAIQGGNLSGGANAHNGGYMTNPQQAKTTIRQVTGNAIQGGNLSGAANAHNAGYMSNHYEAKTTGRQLIENSTQGGNLSGSANAHNAGYTIDTSFAPTTLRQIYEDSIQGGNVSGMANAHNTGYQSNKYYAPPTVKQGTTNIMYMGSQADQPQHTGYMTNKYYAPPTIKQGTTDYLHIGGPSVNVGEMTVYEPFYNMTFDDKKEILNLTGRMPTLSNYEKTPDLNMTEVRLKNDIDRVVYRDVMPESYTYNPNQQVLPGCSTQVNQYLPQENQRLDPATLNSLITNPYNIPIVPIDCSQTPVTQYGYTNYNNPYCNQPQKQVGFGYQQYNPIQLTMPIGFVNTQPVH
jgi:hypothetical protein